MGLSGISPWSLILILAIIMLLFGTKRIGNVGADVGRAIRQFKSAVNEEEKKIAQEDNDIQ